MTTTSRRRPFRPAEADVLPRSGEPFSETAARTPGRRCRGTRTITAVITLADAVMFQDRPCPGCLDCLAEQQLTDACDAARQALAEPWHAPEGVEP